MLENTLRHFKKKSMPHLKSKKSRRIKLKTLFGNFGEKKAALKHLFNKLMNGIIISLT